MSRESRRPIIQLSLLIFVLISACTNPEPPLQDYEVANLWAEMSLKIAKETPANSPTYASRCFGYLGLTMYESVVHSSFEFQSLAGQLSGLSTLPLPDSTFEYDWRLSLNASQSTMLKLIYNQTSAENKLSIDSLQQVIQAHFESHLENASVSKRSTEYGIEIAQSIFQWAKEDGGHRAYLRNFDESWEHPTHIGHWQPPLFAQSFSHQPLHPYWGENRVFMPINGQLEIPEMISYDTAKGSAYYQQFKAVYEKDLALTQTEKEAALWWGDDPDDTFTPPGHSYYISSLVVADKQPSLVESAATYAKVSMSVADAFINCWKWKYHHFTERPNTFIPKYIDERWESFWPDPPFPSFPSGHAIQAAAAARSLELIYGQEYHFVDSAHVDRERDKVRMVDFKPRTFESFWDFALETANSRFYGGIHTPYDNEVGLTEGSRIAENIDQLQWKRQ